MDDAHRCRARRSDGEACRKVRVKGATVCASHGGRAPQVKEAGQRRREIEDAAREVGVYGDPIEIDPADALLNEVHRSYGHVWYLYSKVREQEPDALVWGVTEETTKQATEFPGVDETRSAKPNVWLELYDRERQRLVQVCAAALKAGVEERRVRLAEEQQRQTAEFMRAVIAEFGIPDTPETWERVRAQWQVIEGGRSA